MSTAKVPFIPAQKGAAAPCSSAGAPRSFLTDLLLMADVLHSLRQDGGDMVVIQ